MIGQQCQECKEYYTYNERHDAYFCDKCDVWKEMNCFTNNCYHCNGRPEKPSQLKSYLENNEL